MLLLNIYMDPNNNNPQSGNQNLDKLEQDLEKLTKEAGATAQATPEVPPQPVQPLTQPIEVPPAPVVEPTVPSQPIETPPAPPNVPVEGGKKGSSLMATAMTLLIIAVLVAVGYVAYTKFIATTPMPTTVPVETALPTEIPEVTPQASTSAIPDLTSNWKTYQNSEFTFKYPLDWQIDGKKISSTDSAILLWSFGSSDPMYNECMKLDDTKIIGNLRIKTFSRIVTAEACSGGDTTTMEKWIVKTTGEGFAPGIQYIYKSTQKVEAEKFFNQILSTFQFLSSTPSATPQ